MSGTAANVLVGSAVLKIAPKGTVIPAFDGTNPIVWNVAFKDVGYTEDGCEVGYNPTFKDIEVDEEMAPVQTILTAEKGSISAKLAEATIANMNNAISASSVTTAAATLTKSGYSLLKVGSGAPVEVVVGLEGVNPQGRPRIIIGYRAIAIANVQMAFKKTDKIVIPVEFRLLADSGRAAGDRLFGVYDDTAPHT